jgi:hypothetical protein
MFAKLRAVKEMLTTTTRLKKRRARKTEEMDLAYFYNDAQ